MNDESALEGNEKLGATAGVAGGEASQANGLAPANHEEAIRLAEVGEYLLRGRALDYGDGYEQPRELSIAWEWQQSKPSEYGEGVLLAEATAWHAQMADAGVVTEASKLRAALAKAEAEPSCLACGKPFVTGDRYLFDRSGGEIHANCCGPERESYCDLDTGQPLAADEPLPEPLIWATPERAAIGPEGTDSLVGLVDHFYDPDNWEVTHEAEDVCFVEDWIDDSRSDEPFRVATLICGPDAYAVRVPTAHDDSEVRFFATEQEARAAIAKALPDDGATKRQAPAQAKSLG